MKQDNIREALNLGFCSECHANPGDPCRTVGSFLRGRTRKPHKARLNARLKPVQKEETSNVKARAQISSVESD